jgi:integrase
MGTFSLPKPKTVKSGAVVARQVIPTDIRDEYSRLYGVAWEERWRAPPGTPIAEQKRLYGEWSAEITGRIEALRAAKRGDGISLTHKEAIALAGEWYRWFTAKHEDNPGDPKAWDWVYEWLLDKMHEQASEEVLEDGMAAHPGWERDPDVLAHVRPFIADQGDTARFLASRGIALTNYAHAFFLDCVADNIFAALSLLKRRGLGDYSQDELPATFPPFTQAAKQSADAPISSNSPWSLFAAWQAARQPAASTIDRWRAVFEDLEAHFTGPKAQRLTEDTARAWAKSKFTKKRSAQTVRDTWVSAAHTVYEWAKSERLIPKNPFADVSVTVPRKTRNRESKTFTANEAQTILRAAVAVDEKASAFAAAKRWVPWLCAYSGARVGEMTQLRGQDIEQRGDVWVMRITPEAGTTKNREARTVPLHEHLIEQGFLDYVQRRGRGPLFYEPDAKSAPVDPLKPKRPRPLWTRSELANWVRSLGITDPEVSPNHAWRHSFKRIAQRSGIDPRVHDVITGHASKTAAEDYGKAEVEDMAEALKKFPRYQTESTHVPQRPPTAEGSRRGGER